jgi:hypothetical protein
MLIAIVANATSRFHPWFMCMTIAACCVLEAVAIVKTRPHQHIFFNKLRLLSTCVAGWCGLCGFLATVIDRDQSLVSVIFLGVGVLLIFIILCLWESSFLDGDQSIVSFFGFAIRADAEVEPLGEPLIVREVGEQSSEGDLAANHEHALQDWRQSVGDMQSVQATEGTEAHQKLKNYRRKLEEPRELTMEKRRAYEQKVQEDEHRQEVLSERADAAAASEERSEPEAEPPPGSSSQS